jgi:hypothetical protein
MRAIVLKNHYEPTTSLAYIVRKEVPGIEVFGGISLDLTNGGVNPAAVEWMTKVKGGLRPDCVDANGRLRAQRCPGASPVRSRRKRWTATAYQDQEPAFAPSSPEIKYPEHSRGETRLSLFGIGSSMRLPSHTLRVYLTK